MLLVQYLSCSLLPICIICGLSVNLVVRYYSAELAPDLEEDKEQLGWKK